MSTNYDIIIIGSGPGGYVAAIRASQLGKKVCVVEGAQLGGICLNWGCIPTKALLKSAHVIDYIKNSKEYGVTGEPTIGIDLSAIVDRSRGVSANMSKGIEYLFKKNSVDTIIGWAKIKSPGVVMVTLNSDQSEVELSAKSIIIATGARAKSLPYAPIDGNKIISYRDALIPQKIPASISIIGSGAIGCEMAQFYRTLGSEVNLIEFMPTILPLEDEDVSAQIGRNFRKMGIKVLTSAMVKASSISNNKVLLTLETPKGNQELESEIVLSAVGVIANLENIGLEEVGIKTEKGKIKVNNFYETNIKGIFAIGDVIDTPALAHVASAEGIRCVEHLFGITSDPIDYSNIASCTYTFPEVASCGYSEKRALELGYEFKIGKFPFTASGKAVASGERDGLVKLVIDSKNDTILGAHLVGANVTEMISGIVLARKINAKAKDIINTIHPHPTMSEAIMEAAAAAHGEVIHI